MKKPVLEALPEDGCGFDYLRSQIDELCSTIACRFNLHNARGEPRKAFILNTLMKYPCVGCIAKAFTQPSKWIEIDAIYTENHKLAVNLLTEQLKHRLSKEGLNVLVKDEVSDDYGKVDVLITRINSGVLLKAKGSEIIVEIKTGKRLSYSQLFRYMLDSIDRTIILWRIRNKQVLLFEGTKLKPLLTQFMMMIVSRAERLLSNPVMSCEHALQCQNWSPNQKQLQEAFSDFSDGIVNTLPSVVETVITILDEEEVSY